LQTDHRLTATGNGSDRGNHKIGNAERCLLLSPPTFSFIHPIVPDIPAIIANIVDGMEIRMLSLSKNSGSCLRAATLRTEVEMTTVWIAISMGKEGKIEVSQCFRQASVAFIKSVNESLTCKWSHT
jgi:hypothetical protein